MATKINAVGSFAKSLTDYERVCLEEGDTLRLLIAPISLLGKYMKEFSRLMSFGVQYDSKIGWSIVVDGADGFNKVAEQLDGYECGGFYRVH